MSTVEKRTFSLPSEQAKYIDSLVASGTFASDSEVIRAGLQALQERRESLERWLQEEVVPVYDRMIAEPERGVPASEVRESLNRRHLARLRDGSR